MKKQNIITVLFLSLATIATAQETADMRQKVQVGIKGGISYSNVYDSEGEEFDADAKFGLTAGAFLRIPVGKVFGIQPEVLVTQKGFKGSGTLFGSPYSFKRTTTFFEIPIMAAFKPSPFVTVLLGPQYSYLMSQRDEFTSAALTYDQEQEFKNENIRKNIFGIVGGLDININHLVLSGRVSWDVQNNKGDGSSNTPRYKNMSSQVTVGFRI